MSWDTDGRINPDLGASLPGHMILLVRHGIYIMENLFLEDLARDQDMCQIQAPISFREFKKIVWERAIGNSAS